MKTAKDRDNLLNQNNNLIQPEIIVITSVLPQPTTAGALILYRHLSQADGWTVRVVENPKDQENPDWYIRLMKRLQRTRFHKWVNDLEVMRFAKGWKPQLKLCQPSSSKYIVLTVAEGDKWWAAQRFARENGLPLVTIFHDWWPDMLAVHNVFRQKLERDFERLYQSSDLVLCVSEGMRQLLGPHTNSVVLYPIPAVPQENVPSVDLTSENSSSPLRVFYFGSLLWYGPMLAELLQLVKDSTTLKVQVRGKNPNWTVNFQAEMCDRGLWLNFAPREEFDQWLASADAFLITMSFDPAMQKIMETSFPSKLPESAQFGKPLVIWGPIYCSAIQWGKEGDRALCVTDENPRSLVSALEKLKYSPEQQAYYAQKAKIAAQTEFNPSSIQNKFLEQIQRLIEKT